MSYSMAGTMSAIEENKRLAAERIAYKTTAGTNDRLDEVNKNLEEIKALMQAILMVMKYTNQTAYNQYLIQQKLSEDLGNDG